MFVRMLRKTVYILNTEAHMLQSFVDCDLPEGHFPLR